MRSVARKLRVWKKKVSERREGVKTLQGMAGIDDLDVQVSLIQALIPVGLERVSELLQEEVMRLAGEKGKHGKVNNRWGSLCSNNLSGSRSSLEQPNPRIRSAQSYRGKQPKRRHA